MFRKKPSEIMAKNVEEEARKNAEKERVEKDVAAIDDTDNVPQRSRKSEG